MIQSTCGCKYRSFADIRRSAGMKNIRHFPSKSTEHKTNMIFVSFLNRKPGSQWALEQAKFNLVNNYFLVGVTEEMEDFIYLLELSLPR